MVQKIEIPLTDDVIASIIREALRSENGLQVHVGKIGKNTINSTITLRGELEAFKLEDGELIGFNVSDSAHRTNRSYLTRERNHIERFLDWVKKVRQSGIEGNEAIVGKDGKPVLLNCPQC